MNQHNIILICIGYFLPFVGWMAPLYLKEKESEVQFHGKQSFAINRFYWMVLAIGWVINQFVPTYFNSLMTFLFWITIFTYIGFLFWGGISFLRGNSRLPYFSRIADGLKL